MCVCVRVVFATEIDICPGRHWLIGRGGGFEIYRSLGHQKRKKIRNNTYNWVCPLEKPEITSRGKGAWSYTAGMVRENFEISKPKAHDSGRIMTQSIEIPSRIQSRGHRVHLLTEKSNIEYSHAAVGCIFAEFRWTSNSDALFNHTQKVTIFISIFFLSEVKRLIQKLKCWKAFRSYCLCS